MANADAMAAYDIVRVREGATLDADILFRLKKGAVVSVVETSGGWYRIVTRSGRGGWSHGSLFRPAARDPGAAPLPLPGDTVQGPDATVSFEPENHSAGPIPVQSAKGRGQPGGPPDAMNAGKTVTLTVDIGRVREEPSLDSPVRSSLLKGRVVQVLDTQGDWYRIGLEDGRTGWAHQSLFTVSGQAANAELSPFSSEIKEIQFIETPEGTEVVTFQLNGYFPPDTFSSTVEGPKLICEFPNARLGEGIDRNLKVNGNFIEQIRVGVIRGSRPRIKVIVDLVPLKKYGIRPVFFKDDNLFSLIVQDVD